MGRWAQRRRGRGGGGPATFIIIESAVRSGLDLILTLQFTATITDTDFDPIDFITDVSLQNPNSITNATPSSLQMDFSFATTTDSNITYTGDTPNVETPQTVLIT